MLVLCTVHVHLHMCHIYQTCLLHVHCLTGLNWLSVLDLILLELYSGVVEGVLYIYTELHRLIYTSSQVAIKYIATASYGYSCVAI